MKRNLLYLLTLALLVSSCNKENTETLNIPVSGFNTLTLDDRFDVVLTQGTVEELKVTGHPALTKNVSIDQEGTELHIRSKGGSAWLRPGNNKVTLHITVKELKRININETCNVICSNALTGNEIGMVMTGKYAEAALQLNCNIFYFWNNFPCGGKVLLSGNVQQLKVWNHALMQIEAQELITQSCLIENNSKGTIRSVVQQSLTYKITGEGDIVIKGNPTNIQSLGDEGDGDLLFE